MRGKFASIIILVTMLAGTAAQAQSAGDLRNVVANRSGAPKTAAVSGGPTQVITYGSEPLQTADFWRAKASSPAPLVVFVHGGGWSRGDKDRAAGRKPEHYVKQGYAFAAINYRLVPGATVEDEAQDVAKALKGLLDNAAILGIDRRRVVLMGHSAGAHLVALVGTDERYLSAARLSFADLAGVIPIDGAGYDVPTQMADASAFLKPMYQQAFGTDLSRQQALSPTLQAGAPNAPRFLLLHTARPDAISQSTKLADALRAAGTEVEIGQVAGTGLAGHMEINRRLGDPGYEATPIVDAWLKRVIGR